VSFGNPVEKIHNDVATPIVDENRHYTLYQLDYGEEIPMLNSWKVTVNNQFQDDVELTVIGPVALAVPTRKEGHEAPVCLNHFLIYQVTETEFPEFSVHLTDQFTEEDVVVWGPHYFANPVQKTVDGAVTEIEDPDEHWVLYEIEGGTIEERIQVENQFGPQTLDVLYPYDLAVPSQKISWEQPLDHFHGYWASWAAEPPASFPVDVQLEDQFTTVWLGEPLSANVTGPFVFANPVDKSHDGAWTLVSNWNNHLTLYYLDYSEEPMVWEVTVNNQFGDDQVMYVYGPLWLAVPTKKGGQGPPVGLDHFLVYQVVDVMGTPPEAEVFLADQFTEQWSTLHEPMFFANPVKKTHGTEVTEIMHPDDHLLWYYIDGGIFYEEWLPVVNQFDPQVLSPWQEVLDFLGVPSEKTSWDGPWPY
jgi:hypothetical protein